MNSRDDEDLVVRPATAEEFATAVQWAADEGWNPGLDDLAAFFRADPLGFLMGWKGSTPISSISVVRYGSQFGFLGFYIVHPDHRGTGAGIATWNAGMDYLAGRTVGLDGVPDQQDNYAVSGFTYVHPSVRYTGPTGFDCQTLSGIELRELGAADIDDVQNYDRRFFPDARDAFIRAWVDPTMAETRRSTLAVANGNVVGFATIRKCRTGYKIGPLFADDTAIAESLLGAVCADVPSGSEISLDVPLPNQNAVQLAERIGLKPSFETARMYRGDIPDLPLERMFGITTFELG